MNNSYIFCPVCQCRLAIGKDYYVMSRTIDQHIVGKKHQKKQFESSYDPAQCYDIIFDQINQIVATQSESKQNDRHLAESKQNDRRLAEELIDQEQEKIQLEYVLRLSQRQK